MKDGKVITPPLASSVLPGITRQAVIEICKELGIELHQSSIARELLYLADELFFTGTAAEVTPIRSVDKIIIGKGARGPLTAKVQERFFSVVNATRRRQAGLVVVCLGFPFCVGDQEPTTEPISK